MKRDKDSINNKKKPHLLSGVILIIAGLLVGFLCLEAGLRIAEALKVDWVFFATEGLNQYQIPDSKLGTRIAPDAPGHDAKGFRNKAVPDRVDIVAIGDSQTWGINARRAQAWPQTLGALSGHSAYNMGLGSYGPVQYWVLTEGAIRLSPKVVIIGLYFGNDILDAYNTAYNNDTYSWLRNGQTNSELLPDTVSPQIKDTESEQEKYKTWLERSIFADLGRELNKRSRTLRLLWISWWMLNDLQYKSDEAWAMDHPDEGVVYKKDGIRNILTPSYRLQTLDLDNPRVVEGLRITKKMLLLINDETKSANTKLLLLLIPTKETVYAEAVENSQGQLTPNYAKLVQMEMQVQAEIISLCQENDIQYVNALPSLAEAVQHDEEIYPNYSDGHPLPRGYFLIASTVNEALNRLGWSE